MSEEEKTYNTPSERFKLLDDLDELKSKRIDLAIELNNINASLAQNRLSKVKSIDTFSKRHRGLLVAKKYEIENEMLRTKQKICKLSDIKRSFAKRHF